MSNVVINDTHLINIANAIREKTQTEDRYKPKDMAEAIKKISSGEAEGKFVWEKYNNYKIHDARLYMPFDDNVNDVTGINSPVSVAINSYSDGKFGKSKYFNGSSAYVKIPYTENINIDTGDFTIAFWMKGPFKSENANSVVFSIGDVDYSVNPVAVFGIRMGIYPGGGLFASITTDQTGTGLAIIAGEYTVNASNWTHIALVRKGDVFSVYANGVLVKSVQHQGRMYNRDMVRIGCRIRENGTLESPYLGYLDDLVIVKEALWDGDFTPPTKPFEIESGTLLGYVVSNDSEEYPNKGYLGEEYFIKLNQ